MDADAVTGWESSSTLILWTGRTGYFPSLILADHPRLAPMAVPDSTILWNRALQSRCGEYPV